MRVDISRVMDLRKAFWEPLPGDEKLAIVLGVVGAFRIVVGLDVPYCELFAGRSTCKESSLVDAYSLDTRLSRYIPNLPI